MAGCIFHNGTVKVRVGRLPSVQGGRVFPDQLGGLAYGHGAGSLNSIFNPVAGLFFAAKGFHVAYSLAFAANPFGVQLVDSLGVTVNAFI